MRRHWKSSLQLAKRDRAALRLNKDAEYGERLREPEDPSQVDLNTDFFRNEYPLLSQGLKPSHGQLLVLKRLGSENMTFDFMLSISVGPRGVSWSVRGRLDEFTVALLNREKVALRTPRGHMLTGSAATRSSSTIASDFSPLERNRVVLELFEQLLRNRA
jgi:hypothetical protein